MSVCVEEPPHALRELRFRALDVPPRRHAPNIAQATQDELAGMGKPGLARSFDGRNHFDCYPDFLFEQGTLGNLVLDRIGVRIGGIDDSV